MATFQEQQDAIIAEEERQQQLQERMLGGTPTPNDTVEYAAQAGPYEGQAQDSVRSMGPGGYSGVSGDFGPPQQAAEDRGGITPVIVHGQGGPAEYNGQNYYTPEAAASARALDVHRFQTPEQQQQLAQQQQPPSSIQMQEQIDRTQLSRNEQLELTTTQNGIARLQRDARVGLIPPEQAQQMMSQLQARVQPLMVRQSQLRGMMMAQQYQRNEEAATQRDTTNARMAQFWAANAPGSTIQHRDAGGRVFAESIVSPDGRLHTVTHPEPKPPAARAAGGGAQSDHFDQAYTAATRTVDHMLTAADTSEADRARLGTPEGRQQAIEREVQGRLDMHQRLSTRDYQQRTQLPGGPLPFDPHVQGVDPAPTPRRAAEIGLRTQIQDAMTNGQRGRETQLRHAATAFAAVDGDTGKLSDEDQATLQHELGYYRREFTPEIDRAISYAARPMPGPTVVDPTGVRVTQMVQDPAMANAAAEMRQLLAHNGARPTNADQRRRFDELRGRLGFSTWPPPLQTAATAPAMPVNNGPAAQRQQPAFDSQAAMNLLR